MNCKPRQLARVIDTPATRTAGLVDKIVRVSTLDLEHPTAWIYEGPLLVCACCGCRVKSIEDRALRPIENPPDDAVDESLKWVPRPEQIEAMS
jgi:hypothetical protein